MHRKFFLIFLSAIGLTSLAAFSCSKDSDRRRDPDRRPLIGFSIDGLVIERWQRDRDVFMSRAKELGADVIFQSANEDSDTQIKQLNFLASQNIDVLVVIPNDAEKIAPTLNSIRSQGIPIVAYDRLVPDAKQDAYVCFDNVGNGRLMAEGVLNSIGRGTVAIINGSRSDNNSYLFNKGFHDILDPMVRIDRISIVSEKWLDSWSSEEADKAIRSILARGIVPRAVIAANDQVAEVVIKVLVEKRLMDRVVVVGQDAELSACQRIVEGLQYSTVYKPLESLSSSAAEIAFKLAKNDNILTNTELDSKFGPVPTQMLSTILVSKKNMIEEVINVGFHSYDDVYRNVPLKDRPPRP